MEPIAKMVCIIADLLISIQYLILEFLHYILTDNFHVKFVSGRLK
jgi:hypothetical protein